MKAANRQRFNSWPFLDDIHMYEAPQPRRHAKGVLPVWRRMWACMFHFLEKGFRQPGTLHTNVFGRWERNEVVLVVVVLVTVVADEEVGDNGVGGGDDGTEQADDVSVAAGRRWGWVGLTGEGRTEVVVIMVGGEGGALRVRRWMADVLVCWVGNA